MSASPVHTSISTLLCARLGRRDTGSGTRTIPVLASTDVCYYVLLVCVGIPKPRSARAVHQRVIASSDEPRVNDAVSTVPDEEVLPLWAQPQTVAALIAR